MCKIAIPLVGVLLFRIDIMAILRYAARIPLSREKLNDIAVNKLITFCPLIIPDTNPPGHNTKIYNKPSFKLA